MFQSILIDKITRAIIAWLNDTNSGVDMLNNNRRFHEFMPEDVWKWKSMEHHIDSILALYNYQEIRLSVLQDYKVLHHGITALLDDQEADNVVKQVLNLCAPDDNISLLSLRPEGTISVLHHTAKIFEPDKTHRLYYHGPMFRKDKDLKPMEFYQLGVELLGSDSILSENEIIALGMKLCNELGLAKVKLEINSYGCEVCRRPFFAEVRHFIEEHKDNYCADCYDSLMTNPLAKTKCNDPDCFHTTRKGPRIQDYLCPKCKENFAKVKKIQANLTNDFSVNHHLFKNFAYYNETVFDFVTEHNEKKIVIGGGGRYDYLSTLITGKMIPAVGFYLNLDVIFSILDERRAFIPHKQQFSVYVCTQSNDLEIMMLQIAQELHSHGIVSILSPIISIPDPPSPPPLDYKGTPTTSMEIDNASKQQCSVIIILRDENILEGKALIRNLNKGYQNYVPLNQIIPEILLARKALQQH